MATKYDHLLPPELPRNRQRVDSFPDLDCYPSRYEGVSNLLQVPGVLLELALSIAFIPPRVLGAVLVVLFSKDSSNVE